MTERTDRIEKAARALSDEWDLWKGAPITPILAALSVRLRDLISALDAPEETSPETLVPCVKCGTHVSKHNATTHCEEPRAEACLHTFYKVDLGTRERACQDCGATWRDDGKGWRGGTGR